MVRRVAAPAAVEAPTGLREQLLSRYAPLAVASIPVSGRAAAAAGSLLTARREDGYFVALVAALEAGAPVVLPAYALRPFVEVRPGARFYRVERDGRVVEVEPRRDLADATSIVGWDPAPPPRGSGPPAGSGR